MLNCHRLTVLAAMIFALPVAAQVPQSYTPVGEVQPRHARDIASSRWSVGAETMDRDYTIYDNWKAYLGPLGVKRARIQAGWAKTESVKGLYDWDWLDRIIPDMAAQGVEPWVNLAYGNPLYDGGGGTSLNGGFPEPQAWDAWADFVGAFVDRYKGYVDEWEVWNEPNAVTNGRNYGQFYITTAQAIRARQPGATVIGGVISGGGVNFMDDFLDEVNNAGRIDLVDAISYHPYTANPDGAYGPGSFTDRVRDLAEQYAEPGHAILIRQGESGAPSVNQDNFALRNLPWTENSQAKWNLRRMLGDLGHDVPVSSIFAIADMHYGPERNFDVNHKGMLDTNADKTIDHPKLAYDAVQHVTAIFDDRLNRLTSFAWTDDTAEEVAAFAYADASDRAVVTAWFSGDRAAGRNEQNDMTRVDFTFDGVWFEDPVWVDLLTGAIYEIDATSWSNTAQGSVFDGVPVYDSPILVAERLLVIPEPSAMAIAGLALPMLLWRGRRR